MDQPDGRPFAAGPSGAALSLTQGARPSRRLLPPVEEEDLQAGSPLPAVLDLLLGCPLLSRILPGRRGSRRNRRPLDGPAAFGADRGGGSRRSRRGLPRPDPCGGREPRVRVGAFAL